MSEKNILNFAGLHTSANGFGAVPDGALVEANNVQIIQKGVLEPRRGRKDLGLASNVDQIFFHEGTPIVHDESVNTLYSMPTDTTTHNFGGSYNAPDRASGRIKAVAADQRSYFTSDKGVYRIESTGTGPVLAGAPQTADVFVVGVTSASNGFLAPGNTCAYRVVFGKEDAEGNLILGAPGGRAFGYVAGTDTTSRNTNIGFPVPLGIKENDFFRVYRSGQVPIGSEPEDNLYLVGWKNVTAAEMVVGQINFIDDTPDSLLGDPLYTNPTAEGILQANDLPPLANDIAVWQERLWFGNIKQPQSIEIQLLGVGAGSDGSTGLRAHDNLIFAGQTYTAFSLGDIPVTPNYPFIIYDGAAEPPEASPSLAIEKTARSLVQAINLHSPYISAFYISGPDELPGKIRLVSRTKDHAAFNVTLTTGIVIVTDGGGSLERNANVVTVHVPSWSHGLRPGDTVNVAATTPNANFPVGTKTVVSIPDAVTFTYAETGANDSTSSGGYTVQRLTPVPSFAWNPELPTSGTSVSSDNDAVPHRLYYSKFQEYEAVPALNYLDIGVKGKAILRIMPLASLLIVFKEDGIYSVTGETAPYAVRLIDENVKLLAPDSVVKVRGKLLGLTNQGVVAVSQTGYDIVSGPIENEFVRIAKPDSDGYANLKRYSFAISRETDRLYILYPITDPNATDQKAYVYNVVLNAWTTWDGVGHRCGRVNPDTDAMYIGAATTILKERRDLLETDYYDAEVSSHIDSYTNNPDGTITAITYGADYPFPTGVVVGSLFTCPAAGPAYAIVTAIDGNTISFSNNLDAIDTGMAVTYYIPFNAGFRFNTILAGTPNALKQFSEFKLHFKTKFNYKCSVTTSTDLDPNEQTVVLTDAAYDPSSSLSWGTWYPPKQERDLVPTAHQQCTYFHFKFSIVEAQAYWQLNGISLTFVPGSTATMI